MARWAADRIALNIVPIVDVTPKRDVAGDALGNTVAALELIGRVDSRRARRLARDTTAVILTRDERRPVRAHGAAGFIRIGARVATEYSPEALAIMLVVCATQIRLTRVPVNETALDRAARVRRRQRLEAVAFAERLPEGEHLRAWVRDWLGSAPLESAAQLERDLRFDAEVSDLPGPLRRPPKQSSD